MEKYYIPTDDEITIKFGRYTQKVFSNHKFNYGDKAASKILDNVKNIFVATQDLTKVVNSKNNLLLVGKVQSGKTSNLELLTAMAFDNGFNCLVIYGGYDKMLLKQTVDRFRKTFDVSDESIESDSPEIIVTDESFSVDSFDEDIYETILEDNKPLIIAAMKRPNHLSKVNDLLKNIKNKGLVPFIIDDEGDQASLNTEFREQEKSPTYEEIESMKNILSNPLYISVTATPQANVLLGQYSSLKPDKLKLITPGNGYTGGSSFHIEEGRVKVLSDTDITMIENGDIPESLLNALYYFLISSALMKKQTRYSDMIIHTSGLTKDHNNIYEPIFAHIQDLKDNCKIGSDDFQIQLSRIVSLYNSDYFTKDLMVLSLEELKKEIISVIKHTHIILQNALGKITQEHKKRKFHKIYIGGNLLQRGLTFDKLIVTYFTRWPKSGNMDTTMQRARWFGYRLNYLELCKVYTSEKIKEEFSRLTTAENDLWDQFTLIENGLLTIEDLIIDSMDSTLDPTRKSVVDFRKSDFRRKWQNQKIGVFDEKINKENTEIIEAFLNTHTFIKSDKGRTDGNASTEYSYTNFKDINDMISRCKIIFDFYPLEKRNLLKVMQSDKIVIQKMFDFDVTKTAFRDRSFNIDNEILALQQGADTTDEEKQKYLGDSHVIVDEKAVTVQIFKIRPIKKDIPQNNLVQYMFSVHTPNSKVVFTGVK